MPTPDPTSPTRHSVPDPGGSPTSLVLTVVVPAFNEAQRLTAGLARFGDAVADGAVDPATTEVVVVDDGSSDDTAVVAGEVLRRYPHHRVLRLAANRGKGAAVRAGVAVARGRAVAYMDADMSIDPRCVPGLLGELDVADVALGSRALPQSMVESTYVVRSFMGQLFNALVTSGTGLGLRDTQCGCKAFRTPVARLLFQLGTIDRFAFDVELLTTARRLGLRIGEVPVQWKHVQGSTIHPLHDSLPMLRDVYRSRLGLTRARTVTALLVTGGASGQGRAEAVRAVAPALPTPVPPSVVDGAGGTLVLLPLADAAEVTACAQALEGLLAGMSARPDGDGGQVEPSETVRVTRRVLPVEGLAMLGPLAGRLGTGPAG